MEGVTNPGCEGKILPKWTVKVLAQREFVFGESLGVVSGGEF